MLAGGVAIGQLQQAVAPAELHLGRERVERGRLLIIPGSFRELALAFQGHALAEQLLEPGTVLGGQVGIGHRGKGRAVLEVHRDGAEDNPGAGIAARPQDVVQVRLEVAIDRFPCRRIRRDLVAQEHLHAPPGRSGRGFCP